MDRETYIADPRAEFSPDDVEKSIVNTLMRDTVCFKAALHRGDLNIELMNEATVAGHIDNCDLCQQRENGRAGLN